METVLQHSNAISMHRNLQLKRTLKKRLKIGKKLSKPLPSTTCSARPCFRKATKMMNSVGYAKLKALQPHLFRDGLEQLERRQTTTSLSIQSPRKSKSQMKYNLLETIF